MAILNLNHMKLLRFVTATVGWAERVRTPITVPNQWPFMLVEVLFDEQGTVWLTTALGLPKTSLKALQSQGIYVYDFAELPEAVLDGLSNHFDSSYRDLLKSHDSLAATPPKHKLTLVKK